MSEIEQLAIDKLPCSHCGRPVGKPCETNSGATATRAHSARVRPLELAWRLGFLEGVRHSVDQVSRAVDPDRADLDPRGSVERVLTGLRYFF